MFCIARFFVFAGMHPTCIRQYMVLMLQRAELRSVATNHTRLRGSSFNQLLAQLLEQAALTNQVFWLLELASRPGSSTSVLRVSWCS